MAKQGIREKLTLFGEEMRKRKLNADVRYRHATNTNEADEAYWYSKWQAYREVTSEIEKILEVDNA